MTIVTVDLTNATDPEAQIQRAAAVAHVQAGSSTNRIIVRAPDRATDRLRVYRVDDIAEMLHRHGRIVEIGVTHRGTIVGAADIIRRRGEVAVWTGPAIGPWSPTDITQRGLGGSETAAVRLAEELAKMGYVMTLFGDFEQPGLAGDMVLKHYARFDRTKHIEVLIGFRDATLFDTRPAADFTVLWLEDLAPAEHLTPERAANIDRIVAVSHWHREQCLRAHPWLEEKQVVAGRNGICVHWFRDED